MAVVLPPPPMDLDLSYLSETEQEMIRDVNRRDELLRQELIEHIQ